MRPATTAWARASLPVLLALLSAGCAVGPDWQRPGAPPANGFAVAPWLAETASAAAGQGEAQRLDPANAIAPDWWKRFESPPLDALIEHALAASPTLDAARAALRVADEGVAAQRGGFWPSLQASEESTRTRVAGNLSGNAPGPQGDGSVIGTGQGAPVTYDFHTAQLSVGFVPDVFGANRRAVESLAAQAQAQRFELAAARVTLATNLVAAAVQDASLRRQLALTRSLVEADEQLLALAERRLRAGDASKLDVALQANALAQARAALPPLEAQFEQNRDRMRLLAGEAQDVDVPAFDLATLQLPQDLPAALPSQVVAQRPDILAAEAALHAATAQVGVARAARLPQFTISGDVGGAASHFDQMFWPSGRFFDLALNITQPLFDGGALRHKELGARAALQQAEAQYRGAVLTAFQNVADTLHQLHADARALAAAGAACATSRDALALTARQHDRGYVSRIVLIGAQQAAAQAQLALAQAQAARLQDTAALFQALGGGWWRAGADNAP